MSENQPTIETNDENLDRPWAWLARIPCLYFNELGNPYPGTAELRVSLLNHEHAEDDPIVPPIVVGHADGAVKGSAHYCHDRLVQIMPHNTMADMCLRRGPRVHGYCPLPDFPLADEWRR